MKFPRVYSLEEIANIIGVSFVGDKNFPVEGLNEIHRVEAGDIVFVDHPKYYDKALQSNATIILINKEVECPQGKALLISSDPFSDFIKIGQYFSPFSSSSSPISPHATIGEGTVIQPGVFIADKVTIGKNCIIHANVSINNHCTIGDNVIIHSGTVLGADAFYYKNRDTFYDKLLSVGGVTIEDDVEIGANCTIDRGVTSETIIGKKSKLDNLIQIGHDTVLGERCLIAAQTGVAGCVTIGNRVTIWGQVGIKSGITIEDEVEIFAQSGIIDNLKKGKKYFGSPALEAREAMKQIAKMKNL